METNYSIFKIFQSSDESFEILSHPVHSKKYVIKQILVILLFTCLYGLVMGGYNGFTQSIVTGIKLPALFFLSLIICFPALFVIQYIIGSTMKIYQMANIILSGFIVFSTIAISFAPIVIFFMITGNNYAFLKLLHVSIFIFSGFFGMKTILKGLKYSYEKKNVYPRMGINVFKIWIIIFAFVGTQLAWNLRPFVGSRDLPFELFRQKEGNFYLAVIYSVRDLFKTKEEHEKMEIIKENSLPENIQYDSVKKETQ